MRHKRKEMGYQPAQAIGICAVALNYNILDKEYIDEYIRMDADDSDIVAENIQVIHPDEDFGGVTFEEFSINGAGEIELGAL
jgi:hypothetical protein